ncbi:sugar phosphate isomerase/epimerase [Nitrobacteraceae bacterium AZCC 1564]
MSAPTISKTQDMFPYKNSTLLDAIRTRVPLVVLHALQKAVSRSIPSPLLKCRNLPSSETNLASPNREIVDASVRAYLSVLDVASELDAPWLTINSGCKHMLLPPDDRLVHIFRASLERLVRTAERRGVRLLLENIPGTLLGDAPAAKQFLDAEDYGAIDVLYGVTNAAALGERPADGIRLPADRIRLVHLSDAPAGQWRHDPVGTGAIDFAEIHGALGDIGYKNGVVLEAISDDTLNDLVASRQRLAEFGWKFGAG